VDRGGEAGDGAGGGHVMSKERLQPWEETVLQFGMGLGTVVAGCLALLIHYFVPNNSRPYAVLTMIVVGIWYIVKALWQQWRKDTNLS